MFINGAKLLKRWKITRNKLMEYISVAMPDGKRERRGFNPKLTPYSPGYLRPYTVLNIANGYVYLGGRKRAEERGWICGTVIYEPGDLFESLHEVQFRITDVEAFELNVPTCRRIGGARNLRRDAVRKVAKRLWQENPDLTIVAVIYNDDVNKACEGICYTEKTMRNWVKDLCPNRRGGRRSMIKK